MSRPQLIGITGGIGAGKSVVARMFNLLGIQVYDADSRAKAMMIESESIRSAVTVLFGDESYEHGQLNRKHIGKKAFAEPKLLTQLNALVHPAVDEDFQSWVNQNKSEPYLLKEAALLFETGSYQQLDSVILVTAPRELRIQRVLKRDSHRNKTDIENIINKQLDDSRKEELADQIIRNDESFLVVPQVLELHQQYLVRN